VVADDRNDRHLRVAFAFVAQTVRGRPAPLLEVRALVILERDVVDVDLALGGHVEVEQLAGGDAVLSAVRDREKVCPEVIVLASVGNPYGVLVHASREVLLVRGRDRAAHDELRDRLRDQVLVLRCRRSRRTDADAEVELEMIERLIVVRCTNRDVRAVPVFATEAGNSDQDREQPQRVSPSSSDPSAAPAVPVEVHA
jgi:hypothetical protein